MSDWWTPARRRALSERSAAGGRGKAAAVRLRKELKAQQVEHILDPDQHRVVAVQNEAVEALIAQDED